MKMYVLYSIGHIDGSYHLESRKSDERITLIPIFKAVVLVLGIRPNCCSVRFSCCFYF